MRATQRPRRRGVVLLGAREHATRGRSFVLHVSEEIASELPRAHRGLDVDPHSPWTFEIEERELQSWAAASPRVLAVIAGHRKTTFTLRGPRGATLTLDRRKPCIVGIVNATPDSFSDGGCFHDSPRAIDHALAMVEMGVRWIDLGGESTRPGAPAVAASEEIERVLPIVHGIRARSPVWISIDTTKREVAEAAVNAGCDLVNDVSGGRMDPSLLPWLARRGVPCVLNHMRGTPRTMQDAPHFEGAIEEVHDELEEVRDLAVNSGCSARSIVLDPGIGFGKRLEDNLELLRHVDELNGLGHPVLVGASRKRFLGTLLDRDSPSDRDAGTSAVTAFLVPRRVAAIRVHDARAALDVVTVMRALLGEGDPHHP